MMDRSWIKRSRCSIEYNNGVENFITFAIEKSLSGNKIYCPCQRCINLKLLTPEEVHVHLLKNGFLPSYTKWTFHGERTSSTRESSFSSLHPHSNPPPSIIAQDSLVGQVDVRGLFDDVIRHGIGFDNIDNEPLDDQGNIDDMSEAGDEGHEIGNDNTHGDNSNNQFHKLSEDWNKELYPGCTNFTKIVFILRLYHLKCLFGWSAKSFSMLLELLDEAFPQGASIPTSYYDAKKVIKELGLGYEKIHACPNDCMLFWGSDNVNKDHCTFCNASRWSVSDNGHMFANEEVPVAKKKPSKVLRYFPLLPRLQRLYRSSKTALSMRWHEEGRIKDGVLRHPADAKAWQAFDARFPHFSSDPRSVRLGLASDGFNPFRTMSTTYSTWPVVLVTYNMEPWACMKQSSTMLSMIVPGEKGPGNDIDVFLQPLIAELKDLWIGVKAFDAHTKQDFTLKAALLWTINDFPAYANLSGWSTKGKVACPNCLGSTHSQWLPNGRKFSYTGHRRWLEPNHPYRYQKEQFDGTIELRPPPIKLSGVIIGRQQDKLNFSYGKSSMSSKKRRRNENPTAVSMAVNDDTQVGIFADTDDFIEELDSGERIDGDSNVGANLWKKRSIFFDLPYWKFHLLRHNLDVMHIEKNVCDNVIGTLLNIEGKSKDNEEARLDLEYLGIRKDLHRVINNGKPYLPPACYTMSNKEKDIFLSVVKNLKVPDGYASNISRCVSLKERKLSNLKSHDGHILMQDILPIALRATMTKPVVAVISELSRFFKSLCSKTLIPSELDQLGASAAVLLCQMEKIFPPGFFTIMVHLVIHLVEEVKLGGPVAYRWMYPIERYLCRLKSHVKNKAYPEGSIAEGYIADECLTFISRYFCNLETTFTRHQRNNDSGENLKGYMFNTGGRVLGSTKAITLDVMSHAQAHRYVLLHYDCIASYRSEFLNERREAHQSNQTSSVIEQKWLLENFSEWLSRKVPKMTTENLSSELIAIARGPHHVARRFNSYIINGFRFQTKGIEISRKTQNSGVMVDVDEKPYFGVLTDIYELNYFGTVKVVIFRCDWVDINSPRGFKKDSNGSTLVNFSRLIHTGLRLKDDPFIFASQARQVFYVQDPKNQDWYHVVMTKPRDLYDMGESSSNDDEDQDTSYNQCIPTTMETVALDKCSGWARTDFDD